MAEEDEKNEEDIGSIQPEIKKRRAAKVAMSNLQLGETSDSESEHQCTSKKQAKKEPKSTKPIPKAIESPCDECDEVCPSKSSLKKHKSSVHPTARQINNRIRKEKEEALLNEPSTSGAAPPPILKVKDSPSMPASDLQWIQQIQQSVDRQKQRNNGKGGRKGIRSCDECSAVFDTMIQLRQHMREHERNESMGFLCVVPSCPHKTRSVESLQLIRHYECVRCSKSFNQFTKLVLHYRTDHHLSKITPQMTSIRRCDRCFHMRDDVFYGIRNSTTNFAGESWVEANSIIVECESDTESSAFIDEFRKNCQIARNSVEYGSRKHQKNDGDKENNKEQPAKKRSKKDHGENEDEETSRIEQQIEQCFVPSRSAAIPLFDFFNLPINGCGGGPSASCTILPTRPICSNDD